VSAFIRPKPRNRFLLPSPRFAAAGLLLLAALPGLTPGAAAADAAAERAAPAVESTGSAAAPAGSGSAVAHPTLPAELLPAPQLLRELRSAGLVGGEGEPVAPFSWALEKKRPGRSPKPVWESFEGSPSGPNAGLSPMVRRYAPTEAGNRVLSVRGLTTLRRAGESLDVEVEGLRLPFADGASFKLRWNDDDKASLEQLCSVGQIAPASALHPAMPGNARRIECSGDGRYRGIPVGVGATVFYVERLGVFIETQATIRSPLGPLRSTTRITDFSMP
jgi:hypothetical protein